MVVLWETPGKLNDRLASGYIPYIKTVSGFVLARSRVLAGRSGGGECYR